MPNVAPDPCALDDEADEMHVLRELVEEYDELYELCMDSEHQMAPDDQHKLNLLYDCLSHKEMEYWDTCDENILAIITEGIPVYFPMIRHLLGIMPDFED